MKTILLIEEDEMMRENTTEILELSNYKVFSVEKGSQGLALAVSAKPDIIICDMVLPPADGIVLLKKLKDIGAVHHIPCIIITASAGKTDGFKSKPDGAEIYLSKPFEGTELLRAVEKCLRRA